MTIIRTVTLTEVTAMETKQPNRDSVQQCISFSEGPVWSVVNEDRHTDRHGRETHR